VLSASDVQSAQWSGAAAGVDGTWADAGAMAMMAAQAIKQPQRRVIAARAGAIIPFRRDPNAVIG
jgi:hypothetical protein